ncbi:hypothetical protein CEXT_398781 [Caerostris extrusa]|uniref:Uncharacterized protein n=1 Tax=Caerostris extrusa TaxID=172846 RepID=A0AAV4PLP2_CAEEX|nr:hypothetical protein CEXT_398781 [Caerostris extrusa]
MDLHLIISNSHFFYNKYSTETHVNLRVPFIGDKVFIETTTVTQRIGTYPQTARKGKKDKLERYCESTAKGDIPVENVKIVFISAKFATDLQLAA